MTATRPIRTLAGAKFHSQSYGCNGNRAQREAELLRMPSGFPDAHPSFFDRHPALCTLAIVIAAVAGCFAIWSTFP